MGTKHTLARCVAEGFKRRAAPKRMRIAAAFVALSA
jgi:hypothetical protein